MYLTAAVVATAEKDAVEVVGELEGGGALGLRTSGREEEDEPKVKTIVGVSWPFI